MSVVPQIAANSIVAAGIYALVALGFNLTYGTAKFFNLAHGSTVLIGAYTALLISRLFPGLNPAFTIAGAVLIAGLAGYFLELIVYRPLRKRKASNTVLLVASLGALTLTQALIAIAFTNEFQTLSGFGDRVYTIFGASITGVQITVIMSALLCACGLALLLKKTKFGTAVRAVSDDEEVARIVGIDTEKTIGMVFFIASAIAGFAGALAIFDTGIQPTMGLFILLGGVVSFIVGGIGSIAGVLLGALMLGLIENFGILAIAAEWKVAIVFAVFILFLIFRPQGIIKK